MVVQAPPMQQRETRTATATQRRRQRQALSAGVSGRHSPLAAWCLLIEHGLNLSRRCVAVNVVAFVPQQFRASM
jgi:hypothetical protein